MKKIIFLCLFCYAYSANAQTNAIELYKTIVQDFLDKETLAYQATYLYYENLEATSPSHEMTMQTWKQGEQQYTTFDTYEIFQQDAQMVYISHQDKTIQVLDNQEGTNPLQIQQFLKFVELYELEASQYQTTEGLAGIRFAAAAPSKMKMDLEYDSTTGLLNRMLAVYDFSKEEGAQYEFDQTKIEIQFSNIQLDNFSIPKKKDELLTVSGAQVMGKGKYKGYQVY